MALAEQLDCLPSEVTLWGVVGHNFSADHELSVELEAALPTIVEAIVAHIGREQA